MFDDNDEIFANGMKLEENFKLKKEKLINFFVNQGNASQQLVDLLKSISSETTGKNEADYLKIKSILRLRENLIPQINQSKVVYVYSGFDWQFPVALGSREIDMVDIAFKTEENRKKLLERIKLFDSEAALLDSERPEIKFKLDLSNKGSYDVYVLRLWGCDVQEYKPSYNIATVLEFGGNTSGSSDGTMPVFPNISSHLSIGSTIANFGFGINNLRTESGLEVVGNKSQYLRVSNLEQFQESTKKAFAKSTSPDITEIRAIHARKK